MKKTPCFSGMVRIRVTYEPSAHADIGSAIPCAKAPPAPSLREGLAQGVCRVIHQSVALPTHPPAARKGLRPLLSPLHLTQERFSNRVGLPHPSLSPGAIMNRFEKHHRLAIDFGYSCFDRIVLNGYIPAFQHSACGGTIYWFLRRHRKAPPPRRAYFSKISRDYHDFVEQRARADGIDIITPDKGDRREELVEPFFQQLGGRRGVAVILKARESERIAWYFARSRRTSIERRYVDLYYF